MDDSKTILGQLTIYDLSLSLVLIFAWFIVLLPLALQSNSSGTCGARSRVLERNRHARVRTVAALHHDASSC